MSEIFRRAIVYVNDIKCGQIDEMATGYAFYYYNDYLLRSDALAVSLTLPLRKEKYTSAMLFPFFDGLIPEGWLLDRVCDNWKIDVNDRFGLLLVSCKDPIGNVSIEVLS